jgi:glutathione peroxidase-family protein
LFIITAVPWLWPPLKQLWGNKQTPNDLKTYIKRVMSADPPVTPQGNQMWALMAQLTPTALDILFDPSNNLKKMADSINRNLTKWVEEEYKAKANIIASDFFLGNNLIDIAIKTAASKAVVP